MNPGRRPCAYTMLPDADSPARADRLRLENLKQPIHRMSTRSAGEIIGLIGLGLMGTALTERLLEHGLRVAVWNRTREKAETLLARGAVWSDNPLESCDRVILSLYTTEVVEAVLAH